MRLTCQVLTGYLQLLLAEVRSFKDLLLEYLDLVGCKLGTASLLELMDRRDDVLF